MSWPSGRSGSVRGRSDGELLELQTQMYGEGTTEWPEGHPNRPQSLVTVVPAEKPVPPVTHDARGNPV